MSNQNSSQYKGVFQAKDGKWFAAFKPTTRGPFDFEEEAAYARKIIVKLAREGAEVPSTTAIKAQMPDLSDGRQRPLTAAQKRRLASEELIASLKAKMA